MAPTYPSFYDYSANFPPQNAQILFNFLMPNGILIPLQVSTNALLLEVKEELWEEAMKFPLKELLKEHSCYNFVCVNSMAEQEELVDENRRISDVKPFRSLMRVVERVGDKADETLNHKIGQLIGKTLNDFESLKSLEVNEFRRRMKHMVQNITRAREGMTLLDKIKHLYPCDMADSDELPNYLVPKLPAGNMFVGIRMTSVERTFSFSVYHTTTPFQLLTMTLQKNAALNALYPIEDDIAKDYVLKVSGRQEYLIGDYPLSRFLAVRDCLTKDILPTFVAVPSHSVPLDENDTNVNSPSSVSATDRASRLSSTATLRRDKRPKSISSWTIDVLFSFRVDAVSKLNCADSDIGVQAGIFHGGRSLCEARKTTVKHSNDGECTWDEELTFDLKIRDLPRNARLCLVVYALSKVAKGAKGSRRTLMDSDTEMYINQIAWVNMTIFDYEGLLKTGSGTLYMWTYAEDIQSGEILNPLGTVVSNPYVDHATALSFTLMANYEEKRSIMYPSMEAICDAAAKLRESTEAAARPRDTTEDDKDDSLSVRSFVSSDSAISTASSSSSVRSGEAMPYIAEKLRFVAERDPLHEMFEDDKELLWSHRHQIVHQVPNLLPKLLLCIEWNDYRKTAEMLALLQKWPKLPPIRALELLDFAYADTAVRTYAVECIRHVSDDELLLYLLQLVQALKHESYLECELVEFLISRALCNRKIGHFLFWHLRAEMHVPAVSVRFGLILEAYCRGDPYHMKLLSKQLEALNKLKEASEMAHIKNENQNKIRQMIQDSLKQNSSCDALSDVLCPLDPALRCRHLRLDKFKVMDSKMKPLWTVFENDDLGGSNICFIFKKGDDLRQDMLTLQMLRIMDRLWKQEGLDLRMNPYGCISTGNRVGLIEVVLNASTTANILAEKGFFRATAAFEKESILSWLRDHNPTEAGLNDAVQQFTLSCAGYCVATYVLGIADRHPGNIMVKKNGQFFHIDFGHILGNFKEKFGIRRERVPFVFTPTFEHVITNGHSTNNGPASFIQFQNLCEEAFQILRRHGSFIISLFAMMISTGLPELSSERDLNYLRETMVLDLSEQEALRLFRSKFEEVRKKSWTTSFNNMFNILKHE